MNARVLTANRLGDGAVVYRDAAGNWVEALEQAALAEDEAAEQALLMAGEDALARQLVVGPYLIEVALKAAAPSPLSQRERIRASGPTVAAWPAQVG
ncbi:MAG: DUF2849 domain-containing protein [Alphaproteobacteria bacterium]